MVQKQNSVAYNEWHLFIPEMINQTMFVGYKFTLLDFTMKLASVQGVFMRLSTFE